MQHTHLFLVGVTIESLFHTVKISYDETDCWSSVLTVRNLRPESPLRALHPSSAILTPLSIQSQTSAFNQNQAPFSHAQVHRHKRCVQAAFSQLPQPCPCPQRVPSQCHMDGAGQQLVERQRTHFQLLPEDGPLSQGRAVPAPVAKLELALVDAHLGPFPNDDNSVGPALADRPLPGGETRDLVADDAGSQGHHRGKTPATTKDRGGCGEALPGGRRGAVSRSPAPAGAPGKPPSFPPPLPSPSLSPRLKRR